MTDFDLSHISDEKVLETLEQVVQDFGSEFTYTKPEKYESLETDCFYVHQDGPGCVVGHVLSRLGAPLDALADREGTAASLVMKEMGLSHRVAKALEVAQMKQDAGDTWGAAAEDAQITYKMGH